MKKLNVKVFGGRDQERKLVDFVNDNLILREDILTIGYHNTGVSLYYYTNMLAAYR